LFSVSWPPLPFVAWCLMFWKPLFNDYCQFYKFSGWRLNTDPWLHFA
jgi:hypothetical protein